MIRVKVTATHGHNQYTIMHQGKSYRVDIDGSYEVGDIILGTLQSNRFIEAS